MRSRWNNRDANEGVLLELAYRLGAAWWEEGPLDGWCVHRGRFIPVEIKLPEREGLIHEYTKKQQRFFTWCKTMDVKWWVWRTSEDVIRDLGGRVGA